MVKYKDSKAMSTIEETLAELNEDSYELAITQENGFLPTYMTNIINAGHRVIILHGCKESNSQSDDIAARWVKELVTSPMFTNIRLDNIFIVYLGRTQLPPDLQMIPGLQRIPISQHPDDEDSNFDPSSVAKLIQEEIVNLSPINWQPVAANLPPPPSSTGSRTPAQSADLSPLVTRNPGAGAENPNEDPSASSAEPSQLSLTIEGKPENTTGQAMASDIIGTVTGAKKLLDKMNSELKMASSTASTPATARSRDGDDLTSSPSAPSVIQVVKKDQLEDVVSKVVTQVVEAQGKKTILEIKKAEKEIKDKVEKEGEEIRNKVGEEGDKLQESIELVADATEQTRKEIENQNLKVDQPYDDNDDGGKERGELGSAEIRKDTT